MTFSQHSGSFRPAFSLSSYRLWECSSSRRLLCRGLRHHGEIVGSLAEAKYEIPPEMASRTKSYLMKEMLEVVRRLETHKKQEGRFNGATTISSIRNQVFGLSENQSTKCKRPLKLIT